MGETLASWVAQTLTVPTVTALLAGAIGYGLREIVGRVMARDTFRFQQTHDRSFRELLDLYALYSDAELAVVSFLIGPYEGRSTDEMRSASADAIEALQLRFGALLPILEPATYEAVFTAINNLNIIHVEREGRIDAPRASDIEASEFRKITKTQLYENRCRMVAGIRRQLGLRVVRHPQLRTDPRISKIFERAGVKDEWA